jgi:hypothetical protein
VFSHGKVIAFAKNAFSAFPTKTSLKIRTIILWKRDVVCFWTIHHSALLAT